MIYLPNVWETNIIYIFCLSHTQYIKLQVLQATHGWSHHLKTNKAWQLYALDMASFKNVPYNILEICPCTMTPSKLPHTSHTCGIHKYLPNMLTLMSSLICVSSVTIMEWGQSPWPAGSTHSSPSTWGTRCPKGEWLQLQYHCGGPWRVSFYS